MAVEIVNNLSDENEPDEIPEEDSTEIHGDVETVEGDQETVIEDGNTNLTVIDNDSDAVEAVVTEQVIEDAVTVAVLARDFEEMRERVVALEVTVSMLESRMASDEEAVVNVFEEAEEESAVDENDDENDDESDDREPNSAGVHPLFRSWRDMFGKD
jgi:hypothetical protein